MIDSAYITVRSGNGGNGSASFHRAKYIPKGGPDGGDGGNGGSVWLVGTNQKSTLREFAGAKKYEAPDGEKGGKKQLFGANAEDMEIALPVGTVIWEVTLPEGQVLKASEPPKDEQKRWLGEITDASHRLMVAHGGEGGHGNVHFKSSRNTTPLEYEEGEPGQQKLLWLELKLLADVGFVGLPNAGKSTLLSVLTQARPKIANYPFTTITPNLGVLEFGEGTKEQRQYVLADLPGLIEQASEGKGLGHQFLRHVERCRLFMFVVSPDESMLGWLPDAPEKMVAALQAQWHVVRDELREYNPELLDRPSFVVVNKLDLIDAESRERLRELLSVAFEESDVVFVSAATQFGIAELRQRLQTQLSRLPAPDLHPSEHAQSAVAVFTPETERPKSRPDRHRILRRLKP